MWTSPRVQPTVVWRWQESNYKQSEITDHTAGNEQETSTLPTVSYVKQPAQSHDSAFLTNNTTLPLPTGPSLKTDSFHDDTIINYLFDLIWAHRPILVKLTDVKIYLVFKCKKPNCDDSAVISVKWKRDLTVCNFTDRHYRHFQSYTIHRAADGGVVRDGLIEKQYSFK